MPQILIRGRFWAEEGSRFFPYAWQTPWLHALFASYGGYLNITANVAGMAAWYAVPLVWAPYASTLLALIFQVCPAILLLTSRTPWLRRPAVLVAALLLIATPPASEEVWLSSIAAQCHLALCAALILALEIRGGAVGLFRLVLLPLASLSGPAAWVLVPLFAARAAIDRSPQRALQAGLLAAGVVLQLAFFYYHDPGRTYAVRPVLFLDIAFVKHVLIPFLGHGMAAGPVSDIHAGAVGGHLPWWPAVLMTLVLLASAAVLMLDWRGVPFWLVLAAAALAGISYVGALGNVYDLLTVFAGSRYAFAPQVLIGLALLGCAATRSGWAQWITAGCVLWLLGVGTATYFSPSASAFAHGPSWRRELALHRRDPGHAIAGWPPEWTVPLPH